MEREQTLGDILRLATERARANIPRRYVYGLRTDLRETFRRVRAQGPQTVDCLGRSFVVQPKGDSNA